MQIFISYSNQERQKWIDLNIVQQLKMIDDTIEVCFDKNFPTSSVSDKIEWIEKNINKSKAILVYLTEDYAKKIKTDATEANSASYCKVEYKYYREAMNLYEKKIFVIYDDDISVKKIIKEENVFRQSATYLRGKTERALRDISEFLRADQAQNTNKLDFDNLHLLPNKNMENNGNNLTFAINDPEFPRHVLGVGHLSLNKIIDISVDHKSLLSIYEEFLINGEDIKCFEIGNEVEGVCHIQINNLRFNINASELNTLQDFMVSLSTYFEKSREIAKAFGLGIFEKSTYANFSFRLLTISPKLWEYILKFAKEYDYANGKSEWHIIDYRNTNYFMIYNSIGKNTQFNAGAFLADFTIEKTENNYNDDYWLVHNIPLLNDINSLLDINKRAKWDPLTAYKWIIDEFLPKIASVYKINNIEKYYSRNYSANRIINKENGDIINELQEFYLSNNVSVVSDESKCLYDGLIHCFKVRPRIAIEDIEYIIKKLGLYGTIVKSNNIQMSKDIISHLELSKSSKNLDFSSADDLLRCILVFTDGRSTERLNSDELKRLVDILNIVIKKIEKINMVRICKQMEGF